MIEENIEKLIDFNFLTEMIEFKIKNPIVNINKTNEIRNDDKNTVIDLSSIARTNNKSSTIIPLAITGKI
jgi:hypothetical protein